MTILLVISLGALAFVLFFANHLFTVIKIYNHYFKNEPKVVMNCYFEEENIKNKYPCKLLITINTDINLDCYQFYDFSTYEENGVIGLTVNTNDVRVQNKFKDEDGNYKATIIPNQLVYEMKDGEYQWDFRPFMH